MDTRGNTAGQDHFDLLPFIAILMSVLGCLLLVTLSIAALSVGPGVGEGWVPDGDGCLAAGSRKPVLVEWDGLKGVVHVDGGKRSFDWSEETTRWMAPPHGPSTGQQSSDVSEFVELMEDRRTTHYVLFAVRPSGFGNFNQLAHRFRTRDIVVGYEPIEQDKPIRLIRKGKCHAETI